jgi:hypothetical protein
MDSLALLITAHAAGLQARAEGERLIVRGPKRLTALAQQLLSQKAEILEALEWFEERAAMAEYCGGLSRAEAEKLAWQCVLGVVVGQPHLQGQP